MISFQKNENEIKNDFIKTNTKMNTGTKKVSI